MAGWLAVQRGAGGGSAAAAYGAYYAAAHVHLSSRFGTAFAAFAVIYVLLEQARRGPWRARLGRVHAGATLAGAAAMLAPAFAGTSAPGLLTGVSSAGYLLTLAAQGLFVLVLLDAFRREPDLR